MKKTVEELKIRGVKDLKIHEMKNLTGGYIGFLYAGDMYYEATAINPSGSTIHIHQDPSWDLTMAWMRVWEACGWSVNYTVKYVPIDNGGGVKTYYA